MKLDGRKKKKFSFHGKNFVNFSFALVTKGHFLTENVAVSMEIPAAPSTDTQLSTLPITRKFTAPLTVMKTLSELRLPKSSTKTQTGCVQLAGFFEKI